MKTHMTESTSAHQARQLHEVRSAASIPSRYQQLANSSPQAVQLKQQAALAIASPAAAILQRYQQLADDSTRTLPATHALAQRQPKTNNTGLPDQLKSGIESLAGLSLDAVKVHYNSSRPAQLQAHAYAQGHDIHVGPGQEVHLPHEAWHVVQQAQGRVRPTAQLKGDVALNDDAQLELEADVMGARALAAPSLQLKSRLPVIQRNPAEAPTIAAGHAYCKHKAEWNAALPQADFAVIVADVMNNPDEQKNLGAGGRVAYWKGDTVVIYDPGSGDKGTCFKPVLGKAYYTNLA